MSFVALYRGPSLAAAELVAVSTAPALVAQVAGELLAERQREGVRAEDPALAAVADGKRRALELVRDEAGGGGADRA